MSISEVAADGEFVGAAFRRPRRERVAKQPVGSDLDPSARSEMLAAIPHLRAFAASLCRNPDRVDDLVQDTLVRACANIGQFEAGTNMQAWLITILRNQYYSEYRKRRREVEDVNGVYAETMVTNADQIISVQYNELRAALLRLPDEMREALLLVVVSGLSYPEVARICRCAVGTIKSRVSRARERLAKLLLIEGPADLSDDAVSRSILVRAPAAPFHAH